MRIDTKILALCAVIKGAQKRGAHRSRATPPRSEVSTALSLAEKKVPKLTGCRSGLYEILRARDWCL
jgi:hypothetical protein